jgi:hypothetical protein
MMMLACSGPGAMGAIQQAITFGYFCAAAGGVVTLALALDAWRTRRFRFTLVMAMIMMAIHPAWTVSAVRGDCGGMKTEISFVFTTIFIGLLVFQYVISRNAPSHLTTRRV